MMSPGFMWHKVENIKVCCLPFKVWPCLIYDIDKNLYYYVFVFENFNQSSFIWVEQSVGWSELVFFQYIIISSFLDKNGRLFTGLHLFKLLRSPFLSFIIEVTTTSLSDSENTPWVNELLNRSKLWVKTVAHISLSARLV